jgi:D-lyxose ketol-isomerase
MSLYPKSIKTVKKVWGREEWIYNGAYCGKLLYVTEQFCCSMHKHKIKHETFHLLSGDIILELDGQSINMSPGDSIVIEPGLYHRFTGLADSVMIEFSTQHFDSDSYRTEPSEYLDFMIIIERFGLMHAKPEE